MQNLGHTIDVQENFLDMVWQILYTLLMLKMKNLHSYQIICYLN